MKEKTTSRPPVSRPAKPVAREASRPTTGSRFSSPLKLGGIGSAQGRATGFIRDTRSELKKVVWPTREEAINLTVIVIVVSVAIGLLLGGVDLGFKSLFELIVSLGL